MAGNRSTTIIITKNTKLARNFIYLMLLIANIIYLLVLLMISANPRKNTPSGTTGPSLQYLFILVIFMILGGLILIHGIFIPKAQKIAEPFNRFPMHLMVLILGVDSPSIYGVILGFISLQQSNSINWLFVGIPMAWSFIYGVYFYLFYYQPTLNELEIGKEITRSRARNHY